MVQDYEENETNFVMVEDLNFNYLQNDDTPLIKEFSSDLLKDSTIYEDAMSDLYLNAKTSKYLDDYTGFNKEDLVNQEDILKAEMRGDNLDN